MLKLFATMLDTMNVKYEINHYTSSYNKLIGPNEYFPKETYEILTVHNSPNIPAPEMNSLWLFDVNGNLIGVGHYEGR